MSKNGNGNKNVKNETLDKIAEQLTSAVMEIKEPQEHPVEETKPVGEPEVVTTDSQRLTPTRLPPRDLPEVDDPQKVADHALYAVDVLCEQTAKRIEVMGDELLEGAKRRTQELYDLAHQIRSGGMEAHKRMQEFLNLQTSIMVTAEALRESIAQVAPATLGQ